MIEKRVKPKLRAIPLQHLKTLDVERYHAELGLAPATGEQHHQQASFYTLALDSGARRGELAALTWSDLDLQAGRLTIQRQLFKGGRELVFGPTKSKKARTATRRSR